MWQIYQERLLKRIMNELVERPLSSIHTTKSVLRLAQKVIGADHIYKVAFVEIKEDQGNIGIEVSLAEKEQKNILVH